MTNKLAAIARWLNVRQQLNQSWIDTEIAPPDTQILGEDVRITAAEQEWFNDWQDESVVAGAQAH
ncbi:hypothetical protein HHL11_01965 [Ramlibacter sp. G-1-2-2]|uniref:Uncharacterized protein n=1 Tax=Ramlibacter agri TaxID=2728837 RepID=A0A848GV38_9BURK|nr:hypothetical protein [Ramlibacter agri]NML42496.1 hypothetical protein [Ramlibacter agri]